MLDIPMCNFVKKVKVMSAFSLFSFFIRDECLSILDCAFFPRILDYANKIERPRPLLPFLVTMLCLDTHSAFPILQQRKLESLLFSLFLFLFSRSFGREMDVPGSIWEDLEERDLGHQLHCVNLGT